MSLVTTPINGTTVAGGADILVNQVSSVAVAEAHCLLDISGNLLANNPVIGGIEYNINAAPTITLTYNGDGTVATISGVVGTKTVTATLSYTSGSLTSIAWSAV